MRPRRRDFHGQPTAYHTPASCFRGGSSGTIRTSDSRRSRRSASRFHQGDAPERVRGGRSRRRPSRASWSRIRCSDHTQCKFRGQIQLAYLSNHRKFSIVYYLRRHLLSNVFRISSNKLFFWEKPVKPLFLCTRESNLRLRSSVSPLQIIV